MAPRSVQDVIPVMQEMATLELALAALYGACAERFPDDAEFWGAIRLQEEGHARVLGELAGMLASQPDQFQTGRPFNIVAVRTIRAGVERYTDQVRQGALTKQRAFFVARDIENSVLEASYSEIVQTDNIEFRKAMDLMVKETQAHRSQFAARGKA